MYWLGHVDQFARDRGEAFGQPANGKVAPDGRLAFGAKFARLFRGSQKRFESVREAFGVFCGTGAKFEETASFGGSDEFGKCRRIWQNNGNAGGKRLDDVKPKGLAVRRGHGKDGEA